MLPNRPYRQLLLVAALMSSLACSSAGALRALQQATPPPTCAGAPTAVNGVAWPASCSSKTRAGKSCAGNCISGFTGGGFKAACRRGSDGSLAWAKSTAVAGGCKRQCKGLPATVQFASWPAGCDGTTAGSTCTATCRGGNRGSPSSACLPSGKWSKPSGSCAPIRCDLTALSALGLPGADGWRELPSSFADRCAARAGLPCYSLCDSRAGFVGEGYEISCGADGKWGPPLARDRNGQEVDLLLGCVRPVCAGLPQPVVGASWPASCDNTPPDESCTAPTCDEGFAGEGYTAFCTLDRQTYEASWSTFVTGNCSAIAPPVNP